MRASIGVVLALPLAVAASGPAAADYGWMLSASAVDPHQNEAEALSDAAALHLWLECATGDGVSAAAFSLQPPPGVTVLAFAPRSGFLNGGSSQDLELAVGACPTGPVLAGTWTLFGSGAGSYCLTPCPGNSVVATVDCDPVSPEIHASRQVGFGVGEAPACDEGSPCAVTPVTIAGWGRLKSLYRN